MTAALQSRESISFMRIQRSADIYHPGFRQGRQEFGQRVEDGDIEAERLKFCSRYVSARIGDAD